MLSPWWRKLCRFIKHRVDGQKVTALIRLTSSVVDSWAVSTASTLPLRFASTLPFGLRKAERWPGNTLGLIYTEDCRCWELKARNSVIRLCAGCWLSVRFPNWQWLLVFGKDTLRVFSIDTKHFTRCGGPAWQKSANRTQKKDAFHDLVRWDIYRVPGSYVGMKELLCPSPRLSRHYARVMPCQKGYIIRIETISDRHRPVIEWMELRLLKW